MDSPKKIDPTFVFPAESIIIIPESSSAYPTSTVQKFLREANPFNPLERPCVAGERNCIATKITHPCTGEPEGLWLREYYVPCIWKKILEIGKLPEKRTHCYFCKRYQVARRYAIIRLGVNNNNVEEDYE